MKNTRTIFVCILQDPFQIMQANILIVAISISKTKSVKCVKTFSIFFNSAYFIYCLRLLL